VAPAKNAFARVKADMADFDLNVFLPVMVQQGNDAEVVETVSGAEHSSGGPNQSLSEIATLIFVVRRLLEHAPRELFRSPAATEQALLTGCTLRRRRRRRRRQHDDADDDPGRLACAAAPPSSSTSAQQAAATEVTIDSRRPAWLVYRRRVDAIRNPTQAPA
jgi:hypothetical protein